MGATARQLAWGSFVAAREASRWKAAALAIPDAPLRRDALSSLEHKRGHSDGAALFTILPARRSEALLRLLVAYEVMCDFLDSASERAARAGVANGRQMHLALIDAFDSSRPLSDYYRHHPWKDDGGYLRSLVRACREGCARLPAYERVKAIVIREAVRADVLAVNHHTDSLGRDAGLHEWAADDALRNAAALTWYEATGAASATLTTHVLLALAVERDCSAEAVRRASLAYSPWINLLTTMLDSYVDQPEDRASGNHSYVSHYPSQRCAVKRIGRLIARSLQEALALPDGERHAVIVACMVALYLSKQSARSGELKEGTRSLARAGGSLTHLLLPILRLWRAAYSQSTS